MIVITGGKYKGRHLKLPSKFFDLAIVRPTTSKVREAIFNIINVQNKEICDLFAGSGIMGFESISRSSSAVTFVDNSTILSRLIRQNAAYLETTIKENYDCMDAIKFLKTTRCTFDYVFIDPPYNRYPTYKILHPFINRNILNHKGVIVFEHLKGALISCQKDQDIFNEENLTIWKQKQYGQTEISFIIKEI